MNVCRDAGRRCTHELTAMSWRPRFEIWGHGLGHACAREKGDPPPTLSQKCHFYSVTATRKATFSADPGSWPILGVQNEDSGPPPKNGLFILWRLQENALFRPSLGPDPFRGGRKRSSRRPVQKCQSRGKREKKTPNLGILP